MQFTINSTQQIALSAALCCTGLDAVGGGCTYNSYMLLLHLIPTSTHADPDLCTLCPDLCSLYFPYLNWYKHSIAHMVASCYLLGAAITFSHCMFQIIHLIAHVVISPTAICTGGNFSSSHWCYYCTATYATCTVWYIRLAIYEQHAPMSDEATTLA